MGSVYCVIERFRLLKSIFGEKAAENSAAFKRFDSQANAAHCLCDQNRLRKVDFGLLHPD